MRKKPERLRGMGTALAFIVAGSMRVSPFDGRRCGREASIEMRHWRERETLRNLHPSFRNIPRTLSEEGMIGRSGATRKAGLKYMVRPGSEKSVLLSRAPLSPYFAISPRRYPSSTWATLADAGKQRACAKKSTTHENATKAATRQGGA